MLVRIHGCCYSDVPRRQNVTVNFLFLWLLESILPAPLPQQPLGIRYDCTIQVLPSHSNWNLEIHMAQQKPIKMEWVILTKQQRPESHTHLKGVGSPASHAKLWKNSSTGLVWEAGVLEKTGVKCRCDAAMLGKQGRNTSGPQCTTVQPDYSVLQSYNNITNSVGTILQKCESWPFPSLVTCSTMVSCDAGQWQGAIAES